MTGYNNILDTEIDADSPITTALLSRLRDNPIAVTEGAIGAPRVLAAALTPGMFTRQKIHPSQNQFGVAGVQCQFNPEATPLVIEFSYNALSITEWGGGVYTINFWLGLLGQNYPVSITGHGEAGLFEIHHAGLANPDQWPSNAVECTIQLTELFIPSAG